MLSVKLMSAMPAAAGHIASASARSGSIRCGRPPATAPTVATPACLEAQQRRGRDRQPDGHERRGRARRQVLERHEQPQQHHGQDQRGYRGLRHLLREDDQIAEEAGLREMDAQQLRELIHHDHEADAGLEAGEHRVGDEVGDESQAEEDASPSRTPTRTDSVAAAAMSAAASPPGAARPSSAAVRIAIVVVVLTLSGRDVPSKA